MNIKRRAPIRIRIPSYFFVMMSVISVGTVLAIIIYPQARDKISISFIFNSLAYTEHPIVFLGISSLFILAGFLGASILFRWRLAFDIGIGYCAVALLFLGTITGLGIGVVNDPYATFIALTAIFGGLGIYFWKHRKEWKQC